MASRSDRNRDVIDTVHEYGLHIPSRTIWLESTMDEDGEEHGVNYFMAMTFNKNINILEGISKEEPIFIVMNTGGGSTDHGMAIYDTIKSSPCHITISVMGVAMSMGSAILQSADIRLLYPSARVMFHLGNGHSMGNHIYEGYNAVKDDIKQAKKIDKIIFDAISTKNEKEGKPFTMKKYNDMSNSGKYMTAEEAIEMGLADGIVSQRV